MRRQTSSRYAVTTTTANLRAKRTVDGSGPRHHEGEGAFEIWDDRSGTPSGGHAGFREKSNFDVRRTGEKNEIDA
jgi:hypothetical protein